MIQKISNHLSLRAIFGAILWVFILNTSLLLIRMSFIFSYEAVSPVSWWIEYKSVTPTKSWFKQGEKLLFLSTVRRWWELQTQRQDTLYCYNWDILEKLQTQYRPTVGRETRPALERITRAREYNLPYGEQYSTCQMCWYTLWTTEYWFEKNVHYCTPFFEVNK